MASCCEEGIRLIYACSGAMDVGAIADQVARKLSREGFGSMTCLAGIGANLSGSVESAKTAENIVIDGCKVACSRKNLERIGVPYKTFVLTELGLVKGKTPITDAVIGGMAEKIKQITGSALQSTDGPCTGNCNCG